MLNILPKSSHEEKATTTTTARCFLFIETSKLPLVLGKVGPLEISFRTKCENLKGVIIHMFT